MGGSIHRPPEAGHVDLSMTRYVLEALQALRRSGSDTVMTRALVLSATLAESRRRILLLSRQSRNQQGRRRYGRRFRELWHCDSGWCFGSAGCRRSQRGSSHRECDQLAQGITTSRIARRGSTKGTEQPWGSGLRFYYAHAISRVLPGLPVELASAGLRTAASETRTTLSKKTTR